MEDGSWECRACTFLNQESDLSCSMCVRLRPEFEHLASPYRSSLSESFELFDVDAEQDEVRFEIEARRRRSREQSPLCMLPRLLGNAVSGVLTGMFALVGALTGAVTGALAGRATESGLLRGAGFGAVAGAVLSVEFFEASQTFWFTEYPSRSSSTMGEFLDEILSGRFVRDQVNIDEMTYEELYEMFGPGDISIKGASEATLQALPWYTINDNSENTVGESSSCTICLQEMLYGEIARALPHCKHTFHKACVDEWLIQQGSCPVCRHAI